MATQTLLQEPQVVTVHLREPHAKQEKFLRSKAKRKVIRAGRRGGKTTGIAILAVEKFLDGHRILYAAPTADQLAAFWREIKKALAEPLDAGVYYKNETEHIIDIAEGSEHSVEGRDAVPDKYRQRIRAKTAWNADTLRGDYADILVLDEFQLMDEDAWETVGAPMLLDNNGDAVFIYTPPSLRSTSASKAKDLRHASKMFKRAAADKTGRWEAFHFTSHDNPYISEEALVDITQDMTALAYRQEIEAEDIDEVPGALWTRKLIEDTRVDVAPELKRIVVGVDPSGSSTTEAGIVAAGIGEVNKQDHLFIIADDSLAAPSPKTWATKAVMLYDRLNADRIAGERNYGGDMVKSTIETVDANVSYKDVIATRGKIVRAEPIAALFEKGCAHIVGKLSLLEDELCSYVPGNDSPNRLDAMVWAATDLVKGGTLGLIDFFKQGKAQVIIDTMKRQPVLPTNGNGHVKLEKCVACGCETVQTIDGTKRCAECGHVPESCPACGFETIQKVAGGQLRCQQCGHQFKDAKIMAGSMNRLEYAMEQRSR